MSISQEKLDSFQTRMSNWVASQGLMFQLRHAGGVRGAQSTAFMWFVRMAVRFGMVLLLGVLIFWIYLVKRVDFGGFHTALNDSVVAGLAADSSSSGGIERKRGFIEIAKLDLRGGERAFFDTARIRGIRTKMGLLDGVLTPWNGESVTITELEMEIKAGAEDDELGTAIFSRLFKRSDKFKFSQLDVKDATIRWGYSGLTRGAIENGTLQATRQGEGWSVVVTGGLFSQNWLQRLEIEKIEFALTPSGVEIVEARLKSGDGSMNFIGELKGPATHPTLTGAGSMKGVSFTRFLTPELQEYVGGELSGKFTLGGSPYASGGVTMDMDVVLEEGDRIELRDRFPLVNAISVVDRRRSYKKVRFTTGRFKLRTGGDKLVLEKIWLHAPDVMRLEGDFQVRRPTDEEIDKSTALDTTADLPEEAVSSRTDDEGDGDENAAEKSEELSLKQAAAAEKKRKEEKRRREEFSILNQGPGSDGWVTRLREEERKRSERTSMLEGLLRIGLNPNSFARSPELAELYPVDEASGLRWLDVPLADTLYETGVSLAKDLLTRNRGR